LVADQRGHRSYVGDKLPERARLACWETAVPRVRDMRSRRPEFLEKCRRCSLVNVCLWCPAHAHLETGELDPCPAYFCEVAHARAAAIKAGR
jgi:radical SAM protein with 4Fe4S-binding SPASM domain